MEKPTLGKVIAISIAASLLASLVTSSMIGIYLIQKMKKPAQAQAKPDDAVVQIKDQTNQLDSRMSAMENQLTELRAKTAGYFWLNPESRQYQTVFMNNGILLVALMKIKPQANGYRIGLNIGNINNATYHGARLKITNIYNDDQKKAGEKKSFDDKTLDVAKVFLPGSWTKMDMVVAPLKKKELKYLWIDIEMNSISMPQR